MARRRSPLRPQQERSRFLVDAVLEAASRVTREVGWSNAKIARIAKVAGVSVGSLYRYFPGRDLLLTAVVDRALERDAAAFEEALESMCGPTVYESVEQFLDCLIADRRITDIGLLKELVDVLESAGRIEALRDIFDGLCDRFSRRLVGLHPELELERVMRWTHMAFWGLRGAFIARLRVEAPFCLEAFREDLDGMLEVLLRGSFGGACLTESSE